MKPDTPITNSIARAATDDTGRVTRMEPIWDGLERLERDNARLREALAHELSENRKLAGAEIERHHLTAFMCAQERRLQNVLPA